MNRWLTTSSIAVLALCGFSLMAKPPAGWFAAGSKPTDYDISTDPASQYMGLPSVRLKSITPAIKGFGTMMQSMSADQYHGKRIRFSAFVRSEAIEACAGLWFRVDKGKDSGFRQHAKSGNQRYVGMEKLSGCAGCSRGRNGHCFRNPAGWNR